MDGLGQTVCNSKRFEKNRPENYGRFCPKSSTCLVPADRPDAVDVRLQLKAGERKKNEVALRERWVSDMKRKKETTGKERRMGFKKKKTGKEKKRKKKRKQKKKNVTDGFI